MQSNATLSMQLIFSNKHHHLLDLSVENESRCESIKIINNFISQAKCNRSTDFARYARLFIEMPMLRNRRLAGELTSTSGDAETAPRCKR
jgi:hypothetical protein